MQNIVDERIVKFIKRHHVLTLATCAEWQPWCANAFYTYVEEFNVFVFTSDTNTRHAQEALKNGCVAASVVLETRVVGRVQGLQIEGEMEQTQDEALRKAYLKRFPYASVMELHLWVLRPVRMKLTDNTLVFGKKLIWEKSE